MWIIFAFFLLVWEDEWHRQTLNKRASPRQVTKVTDLLRVKKREKGKKKIDPIL